MSDYVRKDDVVVDVWCNLHIGTRGVCERSRSQYAKVLHIWRADYTQNSCSVALIESAAGYHDPKRDLILEYRDGDPLPLSKINLIAEFLRGDALTLIHCAAGQTRAPTVALIGKIVRGCDPFVALGDITKAVWQARLLTVNIVHKPLSDVLAWAHYR